MEPSRGRMEDGSEGFGPRAGDHAPGLCGNYERASAYECFGEKPLFADGSNPVYITGANTDNG